MADDLALCERARAGDRSAFDALVTRYERQVYGFSLRMLGSVADAEDVCQEVFLAAYRSLRGYRGGSFRSWLLRIAANACLDELRARRRRRVLHLFAPHPDDGEAEPLDPPSPRETPEQSAFRRERSQVLISAIGRLPDDQRAVVVLCDLQGLSYEEAAAVLGAHLGTVRSRLSRARAKLRDWLRATGELPESAERLVDEGRVIREGSRC